MSIDLRKLSHEELKKLQADIERALRRHEKRRLKEARKEVEKLAKQHGVAIEDLLQAQPAKTKKRKGKARKKTAPKYRNPKNPDQTWSGRGRPPAWIVEARAANVPEKKLLIS